MPRLSLFKLSVLTRDTSLISGTRVVLPRTKHKNNKTQRMKEGELPGIETFQGAPQINRAKFKGFGKTKGSGAF